MHQVPLEEDPFTWEWEFCDPSRLIRHLVSECPRLHNAFVQTALTHPTPWSIVVAFDEFDVGDVYLHLALDSFQKESRSGSLYKGVPVFPLKETRARWRCSPYIRL